MLSMNEFKLPLYLKFYQLIKFLYRSVNNFPKQYKYTLGENILCSGWECFDLLIEANVMSNEDKYPKILKLSSTFDQLKVRLRMAQDINLISKKQFAHIQAYYMKEIGEMLGGWLKWARDRNYELGIMNKELGIMNYE